MLDIQARFAAHAAQSPGETELHAKQLRALLSDADAATPTALRLPNSSEFFLQRMLNVFDASRTGTLDFSEFLTGLSICSEGSPAEKFELSFRIFDVDGTGSIARHEMERVLTIMDRQAEELRRGGTAEGDAALSAEERAARAEKVVTTVAKIFATADVDLSNRLTYPEYLKGVLKYPQLVNFDVNCTEEEEEEVDGAGGEGGKGGGGRGADDDDSTPRSILEEMENDPLEEALAVLKRAFQGVKIGSVAASSDADAVDATLLVVYDDATPEKRVVKVIDRR